MKKENGKNNNSMRIDRGALEEEVKQEIVSIIDAASKEVTKDWEKKIDYSKLKTKYEEFVEELPKIIAIFDKMEEIWNLKKFVENPNQFIDLFKMTHIVDDSILIHEIEELKTIQHLNKYLTGILMKTILKLSTLVSYLDITQPNYEENNHTKQLIRVLAQGLMKYITNMTMQYKFISLHDARIIGPQKLKKYPLVEDIKTLSDSYIYVNVYTSISVVKECKHIVYSLFNFLRINKDNWKEVHDSL
ncbi:hypothetical protein RB653_001508 [Dictyostelium firmibasis]|uniref:Uncharacterized protein n=1 Tax=Dictyostelium firmibasis TaxID=79012 RepID=A0AAN7U8I0_9MYCE